MSEDNSVQIEHIKTELAELKKKSQAAKDEETKRLYNDFKRKHYRVLEPDDEMPAPPVAGTPILPDSGRPQPEKNANDDPSTWKSTQMKDDPKLWKVVDDKSVNVADLFDSQADADQYIAYYKAFPTATPEPIPEAPTTPPPTTTTPEAAAPTPQPGQIGPYPAKGSPMQSTQRGPTTRNYASGKPSDNTIEKNVKEIKFDKYQFVTYVQMGEIEHDDNVSLKIGGTHMGSGWFDNGVSFKEGQTCLGYEPDHPETHLCVTKGPKIGSVLGKNIGFATTYSKKDNKTELWTNTGDGWKKQCEGANVGGFNPKSDIGEAQLRIDGFKYMDKPPKISMAVVTEI